MHLCIDKDISPEQRKILEKEERRQAVIKKLNSGKYKFKKHYNIGAGSMAKKINLRKTLGVISDRWITSKRIHNKLRDADLVVSRRTLSDYLRYLRNEGDIEVRGKYTNRMYRRC